MGQNTETISLPSAFSDTEIQTFKVYHEFIRKYNDKINEALTLKLSDHNLWGPIIKERTPEQQKSQNDRSLALQRAAIYEGKWEEYCADLKMQGLTYARMNISYLDWYEVFKIYKELLVIHIKTDPDNTKEKSIILMDGLSKLTDFAMYNIAESYFEEKTNLKKANHELQELTAFMINSTDDAVFSKDLNGLITSWNPSAEKMFGYSAAEMVGKPGSILLPDRRGNEDIEVLEKIQRGQKIVQIETERLKKDGTTFIAAISVSPIKNLSGKFIGLSKIVRDISEQKKILQERNLLFERSIDMIGIAGFDGYFKTLNPAFSKTLGFSNEELFSKSFLEFVHPADVDKTLKEMELINQGHTTISFVNRYLCKSGEYKWLQWNAVKADEAMYCIARDVSRQKLAQEEIKSLNNNLEKTVKERTIQLELANKELESFSYSVAHDLRSPLRGIIGYSAMLLEDYEDKFDAEGKRLLGEIEYNTSRMGALIDDLLTFSKLGRKEINKTTVLMNEIVESSISDLNLEKATTAKITIAKLYNSQVDASLMKNVMTNLISNAIKYSSKTETPIIQIKSEQKEDSIIYSVSDNGVGFNMAYADKLFGVFQRLHSDEEFEGTGVGLAIVQRIVHRHGGKIWAHSKEGEGATFYFSIPNEQLNPS